MTVSAGYISDGCCARKIISGEYGADRLMRITRHRAIEDVAKLLVGTEQVREHGFAMYVVPCRLSRLNAVQKIAVNFPVIRLADPNGHIARAARSVRAHRLCHRRVSERLRCDLVECSDARQRA